MKDPVVNKSQINLLAPPAQPLLDLTLAPKAGNSRLNTINKTNPEIYKSFLFQIKSFINKNPESKKKLSSKSMEIIKKVIQLENSYLFHFCGFINFWFEYYVRIFYPIAFLFFIIYIFVTLLKIDALSYIVLVVEIIIFFSIIGFFIVKDKVEKRKTKKLQEKEIKEQEEQEKINKK